MFENSELTLHIGDKGTHLSDEVQVVSVHIGLFTISQIDSSAARISQTLGEALEHLMMKCNIL